MMSDRKVVYTVELLKEKATAYLADNDSALACEKSFQGCKVALMSYVKNLESTCEIQIVPGNLENPWNYRIFSKLCRLITTKVDPDLSQKIMLGWKTAFEFHVKDWAQNDLTVEEVRFSMNYVLRFIDIIDKELSVDQQMALYLKENLFNLDNEELASAINKGAKSEK